MLNEVRFFEVRIRISALWHSFPSCTK